MRNLQLEPSVSARTSTSGALGSIQGSSRKCLNLSDLERSMYWEVPSERSRLVRSSMYFCCTCIAATVLEMLGSDTEPLTACSISGTAADTGAVEKAAQKTLPPATAEDSDIIRGR